MLDDVAVVGAVAGDDVDGFPADGMAVVVDQAVSLNFMGPFLICGMVVQVHHNCSMRKYVSLDTYSS